jgi:tRNA G26 N,N-dimethylase Trm1
MKKIFGLIMLLIGLFLIICCKKEVVVNPVCLEKAKELLKKDSIQFFKGTISKAELFDKPILVIKNKENGSDYVLDDSCKIIQNCCGYKCDCSYPIWMYKIENKEVVWEN